MWELDYEESWAPKNWCFWTVVLKTLESPLDCKEIQPVNPKGNQSWIFIGRADAEALILWPPDAKNWLTGKDCGAGQDWKQEEKWMTEDEMVGWHHWHDGHEFEQALGVGDGQGSLSSCGPWGLKESDMIELNWTELSASLKLWLAWGCSSILCVLWRGWSDSASKAVQTLRHWSSTPSTQNVTWSSPCLLQS